MLQLVMKFLPISKKEMSERGWDSLDIVLVTGDAYVDHPSYGAAVIGRMLERTGYRIGIIAQPDWRSTADFIKLGRPDLFFGITGGNMDSMVSNYTANKKTRRKDDYSPGGKAGLRPDRATIVYANRIREAFGDIPIVLGGIEASLRRLAHYDWWDDKVRRSILLDARADVLVYGMGETQITEIASRLSKRQSLEGIRGTVIVRSTLEDTGVGCRVSGVGALQETVNHPGRSSVMNWLEPGAEPIAQSVNAVSRPHQVRTGKSSVVSDSSELNLEPGNYESHPLHPTRHNTLSSTPNTKHQTPNTAFTEVPSYEEVTEDKKKFNLALRIIHENQDPFSGKIVVQKHGNRYVIQYPPALPLTNRKLDAIYELPFAKAPHPSYDKAGGVPGFETVKFSLISHRGCPGQCSFCSLSMHQGRIVQSRSKESLVAEAQALTQRKDFRGTISDIGGPTANLYGATCANWSHKGACRNRSCLTPGPCKNLRTGYRESLDVYRAILELSRVKHLFIESGIRFDLLNDAKADEYLDQLSRYHVSGQMKIAPEHSVDHVLRIMNKPGISSYEHFSERFQHANRRAGKKQFLVHYFISAHPGSSLEDTLTLSLYLMSRHVYPEQIQDFIPLPMTLSGAMFHTGEHPLTGQKVAVAKTTHERNMHRALIQYRFSKNKPFVREALNLLKREDLTAQFSAKA